MDEYKNYVIAYIDILGFRKLIQSTIGETPEAKENLQKINEAFLMKDAYIWEGIINDELPKNVIQFSDSIVILIDEASTRKLVEVFDVVKEIQVKLFNGFGLLLRGGITKGKLIYDESTLIGPGLIDAYDLESKCAQYPRIIIDPEVMKMALQEEGKETGHTLSDYDYHYSTAKDFDGMHYIDYFHAIEFMNPINVEEYFKKIFEVIKKHIHSSSPDIRIKYQWLDEKVKNCNYFERYKALYNDIVLK